MADGICDICNIRPATRVVRVLQDGREVELEVCNIDYAKLRQQSQTSPFESLFSGTPFEDFERDFGGMTPARDPYRGNREAVNIEEYISDHTKELLQRAAEAAVRFGRT
ncbi:MAG TPA: hypothetical protein VMR98_04490, partial [Candidatus Polarisedimenticolaceae bacterium]|nr:hypothetical protein [Candidatus Polarisedimenticolaceae bacterium]